MGFDVLDHFGVVVPAEPILPISAQVTPNSGSFRGSQPVSLLASLSGSRIANTEQGTRTPQSCKVMRYSMTPLGSAGLQPAIKDGSRSRENEDLLILSDQCNSSQSHPPAIQTKEILQFLTNHTAAQADYSLSLDAKAALLPVLESVEKEAREAFNRQNNNFLSRKYIIDSSAARLQLEAINDKEHRVAEQRQQNIEQERQEVTNILREIYLQSADEKAKEEGKRRRYAEEVEAFRREEEMLRASRLAAEEAEKEYERRQAHEYMDEIRARAVQSIEKRRIEAKKNQAFVDALIEENKHAKQQEKLEERAMNCYAGPEDNTEILRTHDVQVKKFLKDAHQEAVQERERKVILEQQQLMRERDETRAIRDELQQAQRNYLAHKAEEAAALKEAYSQDINSKRAAAQQKRSLEKAEAQKLKQDIEVEAQYSKTHEQAMTQRQRKWMKAKLNENIREKEVAMKFNMLLDKIKEYESCV